MQWLFLFQLELLPGLQPVIQNDLAVFRGGEAASVWVEVLDLEEPTGEADAACDQVNEAEGGDFLILMGTHQIGST